MAGGGSTAVRHRAMDDSELKSRTAAVHITNLLTLSDLITRFPSRALLNADVITIDCTANATAEMHGTQLCYAVIFKAEIEQWL